MTKIKTLPPDSSIQLLVEVESGPQLIARAFARMRIPGGEKRGRGPTMWGWGWGQCSVSCRVRADKTKESRAKCYK